MAAGLSERPRVETRLVVALGERVRLACLCATLVLASIPGGAVLPNWGIDLSWVTALNMAAGQRLDFGKDLLFTYGPLGFLDVPLAIHPAQLVAGLVTSAIAVAVLWWALDLGLGQAFPQPWASTGATVFAVLLASYSDPALELLIAAPVFALLALRSGWGRGWVPAGLAIAAAAVVQMKFTDGMFIGVFAVLAAAGAQQAPVRRLIEVLVGGASVFLLGWTVAGQSLADLPEWVHGSVQITLGYADAMASEMPTDLLSYILAAVLAAVIGVAAWRWTIGTPVRPRVAIWVIVAAALFIGFKEGFIRHDHFHQAAYFSACVVLVALFVAALGSRWPMVLALVVAVCFSIQNLAWLSPVTAAGRWTAMTQMVLDPHYRNAQLQADAATLRTKYGLPADMRAAVKEHPVMVDPWEATAAWTYELDYHPVPVFQTYSAYNGYLDNLDAQALRTAPADEMVLRQPRDFGLREGLWLAPEYTLTLACTYAVQSSSLRWMLFRKARNRCGSAHTMSTKKVRAGQTVTVPHASVGHIVTARFTPDQGGLGNAIVNLIWKDVHRFYITADGTRHMIARDLASGPLIVSLPGRLGWPTSFDDHTPYHRLSFSSPGTIQFQEIPVHDRA